MHKDRKLVLEDGREYYGYSFGSTSDKYCEVVFNTSPVGYQEILSDPSYTNQAVVMTYPVIGNYGMAADDYETKTPTINAVIVRDYVDTPSNFRSEKTLSEVMKEYDIAGLSGIDTRKLTRSIRDYGTRKGMICSADADTEHVVELLKNYTLPTDEVARVTNSEIYTVKSDCEKYRIALINCGAKQNIIRSLCKNGCTVTVFPYNASAEDIEEIKPDGLVLSNGPGDPTDVPETIETVRSLIGKFPIMGICLGHQIISLAYGAKTYKLKFGHRGGNHPVKNLDTGKIEITSQNHSYAVDIESIENTPLKVTHINILDNTVEGVKCEKDMIFSVQYHPESCPGPQDSHYLFDVFIKNMEDFKNA